MCGIAGFAGPGTERDLAGMMRLIEHRGPDGKGSWRDAMAPVHLGHLRLAIIDLDGGRQPMLNEDGTVVVVFNGEIYNHVELRAELIAAGHRFASGHSDTEVLVHGYEQWGDGLPERLNGMFAFAVYDTVRRRILLARDRFGEKPLYYCHRPGFLGFASELSALAAHPQVPTSYDVRALQKYFAYGFIPAPNSLYAGSQKLPGGHRATYDLDSGSLDIREYWRFRIQTDESMAVRGDESLAEELRALLGKAVAKRLISDVPLGVFLSGGIDSSAILGLAARDCGASGLAAFTVGFSESSYDETPHARIAAAAFGAHHEIEMFDLERCLELLPQLLSGLDEPIADPSLLPTYVVCAFARRHATVALSGDGSDELFAGYDPFSALTPAKIYSSLVPGGLHRGLRGLAELLPRSTRNMSLDFKIRRTLTGLSYPPSQWNPAWLSPVEPSLMRHLFSEPLSADDLYSEAMETWDGCEGELGDKTLAFYTRHYLQDGILAKVDRASMAVALESRAAFLDNDVVDFCARLPFRFKYRSGQRKYILKLAMAGLVPPELLARRKKGFGIPTAAWLRAMPLPMPLADSPALAEGARRWWAEHAAGRADHRMALWAWLSLCHHRIPARAA